LTIRSVLTKGDHRCAKRTAEVTFDLKLNIIVQPDFTEYIARRADGLFSIGTIENNIISVVSSHLLFKVFLRVLQ